MPFKQLWCRDTLHKHSGTRLHVPNVMLSDDPIPSQTYVKLLVLSRPPLTSALPERGDRSASCGRASEALAPCPTHSAQLRAQTVFFLGGVRLSNNPYTRVKGAWSWNFTCRVYGYDYPNRTILGLFWSVYVTILGIHPPKSKISAVLEKLEGGPKSPIATWGTFGIPKRNVYRRCKMHPRLPVLCGKWRLTMLDARL
jgi:hypothetical protein